MKWFGINDLNNFSINCILNGLIEQSIDRGIDWLID